MSDVPQSAADYAAAWRGWWGNLTVWRRCLPAVGVASYLAVIGAIGGLRGDHFTIVGILLALTYAGPAFEGILRFALPLFFTAIIYDSQRFYSDYIRGPIHVREPYLFEKYFFGIHTADGVLTPNEWFQARTHWLLDLVTGFYYLCFIGIFVGMAAYFQFWLPRRRARGAVGAAHALPSAEWVRAHAPAVMWGFFWLNILGYTTYYWYAAAPPWYVALHGLGPAKLDALPNAAGCLRFDALLGTNFFTEMYGRSADVFGAIPSLHIAYPLLAVVYAWKFRSLRAFAVSFFAIMCFSAVYLNHHYILDLVWGAAYALIVAGLTDAWYARKVRS